MVNTRLGFRGFTKPSFISKDEEEKLVGSLRTKNLFVYFTGGRYPARVESGRYNSLRTITEVKTPVPADELLKRAARALGERSGYNPRFVLQGLALHNRGASPTVYIAVERFEDGSYRTAYDIPRPDIGDGKPLKRGTVIIPAPTGTKAIAAPKRA